LAAVIVLGVLVVMLDAERDAVIAPVTLALVILGVLIIIGLAVALILSEASPRRRR